jgi:hypothetical protein
MIKVGRSSVMVHMVSGNGDEQAEQWREVAGIHRAIGHNSHTRSNSKLRLRPPICRGLIFAKSRARFCKADLSFLHSNLSRCKSRKKDRRSGSMSAQGAALGNGTNKMQKLQRGGPQLSPLYSRPRFEERRLRSVFCERIEDSRSRGLYCQSSQTPPKNVLSGRVSEVV